LIYYYNSYQDELESYLSFLDIPRTSRLAEADFAYIDLEKFIFGERFANNYGTSFAQHNLDSKELNSRLNVLLSQLNELDSKGPNKSQYRVVFINLIDIKSSAEEDLFWWSYFYHKFSLSNGKDLQAMREWHRFEEALGPTKIAEFRERREANMSFYINLIKNYLFFDEILFASLSPSLKSKVKFGMDFAEEKFLVTSIRENKASDVCKIVRHGFANPIYHFLRNLEDEPFKLKAHIVSNSKKPESEVLHAAKDILTAIRIEETSIQDTDFVILINDLDLLSVIPELDTDKPIFVIDISLLSSPNFPYLLLKDEGFDQIYSFIKKRPDETYESAVLRSLVPGILSLISKTRFVEQIAINYMDDYFGPLAKSMKKSIRDFKIPINLLIERLETV
jgi:hypothetical protein